MDFLKQWTACVCITLLVALLLTVLAPQGSMKKFYKIIVSVFIFISFLYPFAHFDTKAFEAFDKISQSNTEYSMNDTYEIMIKNRIGNVLEENGIFASVINVEVKTYDGNISVEDVQVAVSDEYNCDYVKDVIFNTLGINARVIINGE